ncbi:MULTISPECIES: YqjD family protein [unclassified Pandoraea]|uniref:DUF883 family protein n=1 Tax=unclassified Pandoraea TaxID=2624094 RepID=UPI001E5953F0|nr:MULTISPECIES: DUF883 domain-containing protein [unclassified Pandoraea]
MNHRQTLVNDAEALLADIKALLRDIADEANPASDEARPALTARLQQLTAQLDTLRTTSRQRVSGWARTTDHYVHDHPWQSVAAAASIAALAAVAGAVVAPMIARGRRTPSDADLRL